MSDIAEGALDGASTEAVSADQAASEATENTEGQPIEAPADADAEAKAKADAEETERKTRNERRREARERDARDLAQARADAQAAQERIAAAQRAAQMIQKPRLQDYGGNVQDHQAALSAYYTLQGADRRQVSLIMEEARAEAERLKAVELQTQRSINEHVNASVAEARARLPDFDHVARAAALQGALLDAVSDSDAPADVAYWLGKNLDERNRIAALSPTQMARAIGRIEAHLSAPKPPPVTKAPDPITPLRGSGTPSKDPARMSGPEYQAWRASGGKPT